MQEYEKAEHDIEHIEGTQQSGKFHENGLQEHDEASAPPVVLTPEQEKALWRKIDLRLMPMLSIMYLMSFLDRGAFSAHFMVDPDHISSSREYWRVTFPPHSRT